ncbi:MAG: polyprenyl synthetase family protein [Lachnospiraceae bacterium]|nr:polyprenyl synthetase family protein [Lachnospiraceae bacterium]
MNFNDELKRRIEYVNNLLDEYAPAEEGFQKNLISAMNYSLMGPGKRLRPIFMKEAYRIFGGEGKVVEPFMAAIEMIHSYSLVHDDLPAMDDDEYRRGRKTTHTVYGEAMAILAGDALLNYAFETALKAYDIEPDNLGIPEALKVLAGKAGVYGMAGGQSVDVELTGKTPDRDTLDFIYRLKTGALIEASMVIGAILAGASGEDVERIRRAAADIGLAFQIRDDILDVTGDQSVTGKPVLSDEKNNKVTYVTFEGIGQSEKDIARLSKEAADIIGSFSDNSSDFLKELVIRLIDREK